MLHTERLMFWQDDRAVRVRKRTTSDEDLPDMPGEQTPSTQLAHTACHSAQLQHVSMLDLERGLTVSWLQHIALASGCKYHMQAWSLHAAGITDHQTTS